MSEHSQPRPGTHRAHAHAGNKFGLALAALGIVYGDIGTSPLYALKDCFAPGHGVPPTVDNVLGVLSLVFWSITLVVVVKYLTFVMRADNNGEGGVLALMALLVRSRAGSLLPTWTLSLGLVGAALLYGDGMITPAVSVLSAVEGLEVATPVLARYVVPVTVLILVMLFMVQSHGTARVGRLFGPATLLWFVSIAVLGLPWIVREPVVLTAMDPRHAVWFFAHHGVHGILILGAVVLCITGGEALYADMGHFGRAPIRIAWYAVVFPALLINYFGQGAMLLHHPTAAANPFFALVPRMWLYPMVAIATTATIVASQALISGAFSLTRSAVQLGYLPRVTIVHTSGQQEGQIYIPSVNLALMISCVALVIGFQRSTALTAAYGIAVTGTMAITSILFYGVARSRWSWPWPRTAALVAGFLVVDLAFLGANLAKIDDGGWFPIAVALVLFTAMSTWKRGRELLQERVKSSTLSLDMFLADLAYSKPHRVPGTAVFMTSNPEGTPRTLLHHFKHNKVLHERVILLCVVTDRTPEVPPAQRLEISELGHDFFLVLGHYGFMETPDVPTIITECAQRGILRDLSDVSYYLGRETLIPTSQRGLAQWRKRLFAFLSQNARPATAFFDIPPNRVVELGVQIEL